MAPTVSRIDFSTTPLASHYTGFYAVIIDDFLSPAECASLSARAGADWIPAGLMARGTTQTVHSDFRNSDRILLVDEEASTGVYEKLAPLLPELHVLAPDGEWGGIVGKVAKAKEAKKPARTQKASWRLVRVNPRLSFLRYGPGQYFKQHCDGLNELTEGLAVPQKSFVTLHVYLNGPPAGAGDSPSPDPLVGGATRFWTPDKKHFLDVEPRVGRVLVFQQRMLVHSGEEVLSGVKYTMRGDFMYEQI
ncbi:P4Hc domain-containing protein [Mycena chlorophos]|uniref:P4Hc domain-containing protein n=1 Tax=Mycena chlorophos TaxID=658473 RepID=A0A8H6VZU7_MYCCL|nr:P4Hc domain-containing protein [Mycena chlorophos]